MIPSATPEQSLIQRNTPEFRRANLALFAGGFATFALLYCVQPLLPVFARDFHVSAAQSSLALSLTTVLLAPAMIVAGIFSEVRGRKTIMVWSLFASAWLTFSSAFVTDWHGMLIIRAAVGISFAGLPAISMTYVSEEIHPGSVGLAMGLLIAGNGLGGMTGRLLASYVADLFSWRWAVGFIGVVGLVATYIFWRTLPPSRHFVSRSLRVKQIALDFGAQLRDARLIALYAIGFLLMGALVASYNYVTYHLLDAPYSLSQSGAGSIFVVYLSGIFASAWIGSMADKRGRGLMLVLMSSLVLGGIVLSLARSLVFVVAGIVAVTFGFFGGHSVASSWVGLRAKHAKAQASALYLFFYYIGASVAGTVGGVVWDAAHWSGVVLLVGAMALGAVGIAVFNARWA